MASPLALPHVTVTPWLLSDTHLWSHLARAKHIEGNQALQTKAFPPPGTPAGCADVSGKVIDVSSLQGGEDQLPSPGGQRGAHGVTLTI